MTYKKLTLFSIGLVLLYLVLVKSHSQEKNFNVINLHKVGVTDVAGSVYTSGNITFTDKATLTSEIVAKVKSIYVEEGDTVKQGQPLIQLYADDIKKEIEQQEVVVANREIQSRKSLALLNNSKNNWTRVNSLHNKKLSNDYDLDEAALDLELRKIEYEESKNYLSQAYVALSIVKEKASKALIESPINGVVFSLLIKEGEVAIGSAMSIAGSELIVIADPKSFIVEAQVPEYDIARVQINQPTKVYLTSEPNTPLKGKVIKIGTKFLSTSQSKGNELPINIALDTSSLKLIDGMTCEVELLESSKSNTITVPISAIQYEEEKASFDKGYISGSIKKYFVYKIVNNIAIKSYVQIGISDIERQEIIEGVELNDIIISGPSSLLANIKEGIEVTENNWIINVQDI
ncbi:efflux RND transporter periplasmic adaptor subunit [Psychrosphaera haliotis]|uniref:Efflux RND transporter periplasmic adaptor subunit n=1 Tax=Psychrosphaera haliotis TaxID=555083 RepID=A0A6N8F8D9_9GAMM|nr:efflux RND transporter periplasmic adaptor subunit [Psychrosphaera haliotis]MUH72806.1 efflux RND transporter periplasmic adaptor subunit [Psychrosphaera haliotis]